jgi:CCR4-NOT complex subunit CAF16
MSGLQEEVKPPTIEVNHLTFNFPDGTTGLRDISLSLPAASRTLLIGANGAGKTSLLRLLSGARMSPAGSVSVSGVDPFAAGLEGVTYLGLEWVLNPIVRRDMDVPTLLRSIGGDAFPARRDELVRVLDIDLAWRMHAVSDGERRRVQIAMGLLRPWRVLLLDEVTVDLDLLSRSDFLAFLRRETETRTCTIVYATHILDNLTNWPTHLVHMSRGCVEEWGPLGDMLALVPAPSVAGRSHLSRLVMYWLREDLRLRGPRNQPKSQGQTYQSFEGLGGYGLEKTM